MALQSDQGYILAIDIGTSHVRALLYSRDSGVLAQSAQGYPTFYPQLFYVEQDPDEIFQAVVEVIQEVMQIASLPAGQVRALVFAGINQSLIPVDQDGIALMHSFNWADKRALTQNTRLRKQFNLEEIKKKTGCTLHPMYHLPRLIWIKEEAPQIFTQAKRFISIKEYITERLFDEELVDYSIASGTGLWNMHTKNWDNDLLKAAGVKPEQFSRCVETTTLFSKGLTARVAAQVGLKAGTPGVIGAYDGALAHLGSVGMRDDLMSFTVGTGAALRRKQNAPNIIPGTEAWCYYLAEDNWLLGGVLHDSGNVLKWFVDRFLSSIPDQADAYAHFEELASSVPAGSEGLMLIPHLGGERCPHDFPESEGLLYGLTFNHGLNHLARAILEGLTYNLYSVYRMIAPDLAPTLVISGGILNSPTWLQIVADFFQKELWLPKVQEATAWGGVILALKALGEVADFDTFNLEITPENKVEPIQSNLATYQKLLSDLDVLYEHKSIYEKKKYTNQGE